MDIHFHSLPAYRRSYNRYRIDGQATLCLKEDLKVPAILKDISSRGAGVVINHSLKTQDRIDIVMMLSPFVAQPVCRKALVVWCQQLSPRVWQAGLDFGLDGQVGLD